MIPKQSLYRYDCKCCNTVVAYYNHSKSLYVLLGDYCTRCGSQIDVGVIKSNHDTVYIHELIINSTTNINT